MSHSYMCGHSIHGVLLLVAFREHPGSLRQMFEKAREFYLSECLRVPDQYIIFGGDLKFQQVNFESRCLLFANLVWNNDFTKQSHYWFCFVPASLLHSP